MSNADITKGPFRRPMPIAIMGKDSDELIVERGIFTFGASADADELALSFVGEAKTAFFTKKSATGLTQADGLIVTDLTITSGKMTVARTAHADGAISAFYEVTGYPKDS